ncbi:MAG TPA: hypothetical protein EYQ44_02430 [Porticoccaceae bacterium]|nr:hypothetical protein [Porticoccaceae bacterium]
MSAKDRYILAANQFAFQGGLKKSLDANEGAFINSISMGDYVRMLIDEGVLNEPPTKEQSEAYTKEALANNTPYYLNENPSMDWARNALDTITKLGVTSGSLTPNYDPKREVFVDWGSSTPQSVQRDKYNPNPLASLSASPAGEASPGVGYQSKYQDSLGGFGSWAAGLYDNPLITLGANDLRVDSRQKVWDKALAAANNVWGSAENYQPVAKPSWGGAGTAGYYTQAEARSGKTNFGTFVPKKPSEVGLTFEEFSDKQDLKDWQADKFRFGLEKPPSKRNAVGGGSHLTAAYDGYGNVRSQMPSINTVDEYIALRDSGELARLKGYSNLMSDNKALFDKSGKKLTEDNLGFNNYAEYRALDGLALETAEKRTWGYSSYYTAEALEDKTRRNHEGNLKEKGRRKAAASIAIGLATGGAAAGGAFGGTVAGSSALTGALAGAAGGAVTGGLDGALKGAALGGIGGYAKDAFTGVGGLEGISDSIGMGDVYDGVSGAVGDFTGAVGDFAGGVADDFTGAVGDAANAVNPFYEAPTSIGLGNTTFNPLPTADMALAGDYSMIPNSGDVFFDNLVKSTTPYNPLPTADSAGYLSDLDLVTQNPSVFNGDTIAPFDPATLGMSDTQIVAEQMFPVVENSAGRINGVADNLMVGAVNVADYTSAPIPSMVDVMSGAATINNDGMLGNIEPTSASPAYDFASTAPDKTSLEQQFVDDALKTDAYNPLPTADSFAGMLPESLVDTAAIKTGLEMLSGAGGEQAQPVGSGITSAPFVGATGSGFKDNRLKSQLLRGVNPLLLRRGLLG